MKNKLNLENLERGEFKIGELFDIKKVYGLPMEKYNSGKTPYISTSTTNNGLISFVNGAQEDMSIKNAISIDPIAGKTFYHSYDFIGRGFSGASINLLYNESLNKFSALFICNMIEKISKEKASYGNLFNSYRLKGAKILLPKTSDGNPDWDFMENYMKQIENKKLEKIISYYKQKCIENDLTLSLSLSGLDNNQKYWKEFLVEEIFEIGTGATISQKDFEVGNIPRITVSDNNNGVALFTENFDNKNFRTLKNFISISFLGSVFYHPYEASLDMKVHTIQPKNFVLNRYNAIFLINLLKNFTQKYSYGYQLSTSILKKQKILLPVDNLGNPDFLYMENYMKKIEEKTLKEVVQYFEERLEKNKNLAGGGYNINNLEWGEFLLENIFEIFSTKNGIDKNKLNGKSGKFPYITRTENNNGIDNFIAEQENFSKNSGNVITIGLDTQTIFYQENIFYTGQNIQILRNDYLNKYIAEFVKVPIKKLMGKFSWGGNGATLTRLKRSKILLPKDNLGNPDWNFMENYMRIQEQKLILEYLKKFFQKNTL